MALGQRELVKAGPVERCESGCGSMVRVAQYEGGKPRLNVVRNGIDVPGGHPPDDCRDRRDRAEREDPK